MDFYLLKVMMIKMLKQEDLNNPLYVFDYQTEEVKNRILILQKDLKKVKHFYTKAIIEEECERCINDYVARSLSIQKTKGE